MPNQILVVVDSINIDDSSGSKANVALIENLSAIGYPITVLHYTMKRIELDGVKCISIPEKKFNIIYVLSRLQRFIQRYLNVNLAKYLEPFFGFSFTFFNDINSIKTSIKKINASKFDLIITLSKGSSFRPHYAVNKFPDLYNKWLAYVHDPYPFSCYPPPYDWKEPGYKQKMAFFKNVSENAQNAAFPSLLLKDWMGNFFPNFNKTGIIIPHQNFEVQVTHFKKPVYFDDTKFNILHAGNLMKQRNPEGLLKGFNLFLENDPEAKKHARLLLLGNASYHETLIEEYDNLIPELYIDLKNIPFNKVYWLQKNVSVNIILEANGAISPFLPGKFPHCVKANKPILHLGPKYSETKRLLGENYPYCSEINDEQSILRILQKLFDDWLIHRKTLVLNRPDLEAYLGKRHLKEQLELIFNHD